MKYVLIILSVFYGFAYTQDTLITGLYINEIMAHNDYAIYDEYGEADDWFEIYNSNSYSVDIGGLYLSDRSGHPEKYHVPDTNSSETTIAAGDFMLIWADDQEDQGPLHTNFILSHDGEFTSISQMIDGSLQYIDSTSYPAIGPDTSWGRYTDASSNWWYYYPSSPGESNNDDDPLPVELMFFTASTGDEQIILHWNTASEIGNMGFALLRSKKKEGGYREIDSYKNNIHLLGAGNSSQAHEYQYVDMNVEDGYTYWYKLVEIDINGMRTEIGQVSVTLTNELVSGEVPQNFKLFNYPNPFNPSTTIVFDLSSFRQDMVSVRLTIFDMLGRKVRSLFVGDLPTVRHTFEWDGLDDRGQSAPSGVYIYYLQTEYLKKSNKMLLMR